MKLNLYMHDEKITINHIERCKNNLRGLMFTSKHHAPLLFEFPYPGRWGIHSFFVFYTFLALWIHHGKIVDCTFVKPFSFLHKPRAECTQLLEIPCNEKTKVVIDFFRR